MATFLLVSGIATSEGIPLWGTHRVGCGIKGKCVQKKQKPCCKPCWNEFLGRKVGRKCLCTL